MSNKLFIALFLVSYLLFPCAALANREVRVYVYSVIDGSKYNVEETETKIKDFNNTAIQALTEASAYKKYNNTSVSSYLNYKIVGETFVSEPVRPGLVINVDAGAFRPDYKYYLQDIDICDLVDKNGVEQVWFWTQHDDRIVPVESNMSMGRVSKKYWNNSEYGDISNSERSNDLPTCNNTYTLFNYNFERGVGEMLENQTHQIEHLLNHLDGRGTTPNNEWGDLLFWGKFVGSDISHKIINPGCGWTHYPPNGESDYDWRNSRVVQSDCANWNPQGSGQKEPVSCETWYGGECVDDGGIKFKVWWMQNLPGEGNGLSYEGKDLRNWWDVVVDFDTVLAEESGLYTSSAATYFHNFDVNKDGQVSIIDVIAIVKYMFR